MKWNLAVVEKYIMFLNVFEESKAGKESKAGASRICIHNSVPEDTCRAPVQIFDITHRMYLAARRTSSRQGVNLVLILPSPKIMQASFTIFSDQKH
jgi:hypothetical protein